MLRDVIEEAIGSLELDDEGTPNQITSSKEIIDKATVSRLAAMKPLDYDRVRDNEAQQLGVRVAVLDKVVAAKRKDESAPSPDFPEVLPWNVAIDPDHLLKEISDTVRRFIVCQEETAHAVALWAAMTWFMDVVQVAPLAVITAPEKRCGKSQLLFLLSKLVHRPLPASNISSAALFRSIDAWQPTLIVDEADSFMKENEELRGLLNCGHTRDSAYTIRVVGDDHTPKRFSVWGAKALAGIGHLADTLMDRAIVLELRRKLSNERTDRLRHAKSELFIPLASKLARFAQDYREAIRITRPALPESLNDRAQDNWEPLLAIADVAGGPWPGWARKAALKLSGAVNPTQSIGTELLSDIQEVFEYKGVDRIHTKTLLEALCEDPEKLWATSNRGKPFSPRQLSNRLSGYGIKSKTLRVGYENAKGFEREQFQEAFDRYLISPTPPENSRHTSQSAPDAEMAVTDGKNVTVTKTLSVTRKTAPDVDCDGVTDKKGGMGEGRVFHDI